MSLKHRIEEMQQELMLKKNAVDVYEKELRILKDSRVHCDYEWDTGIKGYEHEGRYCTKCGINELYMHTLKSWLVKQQI